MCQIRNDFTIRWLNIHIFWVCVCYVPRHIYAFNDQAPTIHSRHFLLQSQLLLSCICFWNHCLGLHLFRTLFIYIVKCKQLTIKAFAINFTHKTTLSSSNVSDISKWTGQIHFQPNYVMFLGFCWYFGCCLLIHRLLCDNFYGSKLKTVSILRKLISFCMQIILKFDNWSTPMSQRIHKLGQQIPTKWI